jgi:hypothetical protein
MNGGNVARTRILRSFRARVAGLPPVRHGATDAVSQVSGAQDGQKKRYEHSVGD